LVNDDDFAKELRRSKDDIDECQHNDYNHDEHMVAQTKKLLLYKIETTIAHFNTKHFQLIALLSNTPSNYQMFS